MSETPATERRKSIVDALRLFQLPLAAFGVAWLLSLTALFAQLSDAVDDAVLRATAQPSVYADVAVVDFDDASLIELRPQLGAWPFSRDIYATLIGFLRDAGARLIVFDIVFGEPREGDAAFANLIDGAADIVLGAAAMTDRLEAQPTAEQVVRFSTSPNSDQAITSWPGLKLPTAELRNSLREFGAIGIITTPLDSDGVLRRLPLLHLIDARVFPSLPLAALLKEVDASASQLQPTAHQLRFKQHIWPVDSSGLARLALPSNVAQLPSIGAGKVMAAALGLNDAVALRQRVRDKVVFIGSSAFLGDRVVTAQGQLTGVSVLASTYDALRRDDLIRTAAWPLNLALLTIALLPGLLVVRRGRPDILRDTPIAIGAILIVAAVALVMLSARREQVSPLLPLTIIALGFLFTALQQVRWTSRVNRDLREQRLAAVVANAAKSDFLAGVSHELRTPLHAVLGMADVLSQTRLDAEQHRYVEVFRNAGKTLASLIDDLLDLSRIEAAQVSLDLLPFSIRELTAAMMALMQPRALAKGLRLELEIAEDLDDQVLGDAKRLMQVLVNLTGNAIKFTQQGSVSISIERQAQGLLHTKVRDTGIGIAGSKLELIFEPFTQADGSVTRNYGGSGLGLSITRRLVMLMGGQLWVESEPGQGSTFHFTADLPVTEQPVTALAPDAPVLIAPLQADAIAPVHILLVEDNEVNVIVVEAMINGGPHTLEVAQSGEAGVEMFRSNNYGLVLMDVHMPGMNGYEATRAIRDIEAERGDLPTAVLALSASAFESDRQASVAAGCNGHLSKPLSRQHLLDAIATHGKPVPRRVDDARPTDQILDHQAALLFADSDEARRQRNFEHAKVFLIGWQSAFGAARAAANQALQRALCEDLCRVAQGAGATELAAAAAELEQAMTAASAADLEPVIDKLMRQLQRANAAITLARW